MEVGSSEQRRLPKPSAARQSLSCSFRWVLVHCSTTSSSWGGTGTPAAPSAPSRHPHSPRAGTEPRGAPPAPEGGRSVGQTAPLGVPPPHPPPWVRGWGCPQPPPAPSPPSCSHRSRGGGGGHTHTQIPPAGRGCHGGGMGGQDTRSPVWGPAAESDTSSSLTPPLAGRGGRAINSVPDIPPGGPRSVLRPNWEELGQGREPGQAQPPLPPHPTSPPPPRHLPIPPGGGSGFSSPLPQQLLPPPPPPPVSFLGAHEAPGQVGEGEGGAWHPPHPPRPIPVLPSGPSPCLSPPSIPPLFPDPSSHPPNISQFPQSPPPSIPPPPQF